MIDKNKDSILLEWKCFKEKYGEINVSDFHLNNMISKRDLAVILTLWNRIKPEVAIEFGINRGNTAKELLKHSPWLIKYVGIDVDFKFKTTLIEQQKEVIEDVGSEVKGDERVEIMILPDGSQVLHSQDLPRADFIFIDGDHSLKGILNDSLLAKSIIKPGGIICWHDYRVVADVTQVLTFLHIKKGWCIRHVEDSFVCFELIDK